MVVTHLMQVMAFVAMEPPTALEPRSISEEKNKVFRSMLPIHPHDAVRGQFGGYRDHQDVAGDSDTETFIALKVGLDNWRWAGVPFYLRTGKRLAEGQRIISIAFKEAPRTMFPQGSGVGTQGPDHLTFDLADSSRVSLSFYGKRPGPGMRLQKLSMQFSTQETGEASDVLEAYERLILDAMRGDHTLFTTSEGIESLWERSLPLLADPPPVKPYPVGSWGPNAIHQLIAPNAWRLPFERAVAGEEVGAQLPRPSSGPGGATMVFRARSILLRRRHMRSPPTTLRKPKRLPSTPDMPGAARLPSTRCREGLVDRPVHVARGRRGVGPPGGQLVGTLGRRHAAGAVLVEPPEVAPGIAQAREALAAVERGRLRDHLGAGPPRAAHDVVDVAHVDLEQGGGGGPVGLGVADHDRRAAHADLGVDQQVVGVDGVSGAGLTPAEDVGDEPEERRRTTGSADRDEGVHRAVAGREVGSVEHWGHEPQAAGRGGQERSAC